MLNAFSYIKHVHSSVSCLHAFFISNTCFQLSLSVAQFFDELSFKCCLGVLNKYKHHHNETVLIFTTFVSMSLDLGLFMSYLCDLFFIFIFIFIMINPIISCIQTHLVFCFFLEYVLLLLD